MTRDLDPVLRQATSVRVTRAGEFDPRHRRREKPIIIESDAGALEELRRCLAIDEGSLAEQYAFMTLGLVDLNFLAGHRLLATVGFIFPDFARWPGWGWDARLVDGSRLVRWLVERGWVEPHHP